MTGTARLVGIREKEISQVSTHKLEPVTQQLDIKNVE
jgi:hypothetical protein